MNIRYKPMGAYQTNCYIVEVDGKELIIDPGQEADKWLFEELKNPIAILNTHGHFDHVWSNQAVKEKFKIPIYCPKGDAFMLESDPFSQGTPSSSPDVLIDGDRKLDIKGVEVEYLHFPGHTPGNSAIVIGEAFFSGDFIFENSIGRVDFPYSNPTDMKRSINKFLKLPYDKRIYPGHGNPTTVKTEQSRVGGWLDYL
jgi:glyoxylase-like metal-dependent hydrolase (beta-lactamase superfamily II)